MNIRIAWSRKQTTNLLTDEEGFAEYEFSFNTGERIKEEVKLLNIQEFCSFWQAVPLTNSANCLYKCRDLGNKKW